MTETGHLYLTRKLKRVFQKDILECKTVYWVNLMAETHVGIS